MIQSIESYIITDGNGQEALAFYQEVLGAKLESLTLWEQGVPNCPDEHKHLVMNAQLRVDGIRIQLSDESPDYPYVAGRNVSIALIVDTVETAETLYRGLSQDSLDIFVPLGETPWSPAYACLRDKYGVMWQISTELES